jgi:hypothetical protein
MRVLVLIFSGIVSSSLLGQSYPSNMPDQFTEQIRAELARWERVVRQANIKIE